MSNKRIGCENFGKFYTEGKVRNRREWRGVKDTLYDYSRWLHIMTILGKVHRPSRATSRPCSAIAGWPTIWLCP